MTTEITFNNGSREWVPGSRINNIDGFQLLHPPHSHPHPYPHSRTIFRSTLYPRARSWSFAR